LNQHTGDEPGSSDKAVIRCEMRILGRAREMGAIGALVIDDTINRRADWIHHQSLTIHFGSETFTKFTALWV
jgi:hypothetical protein